jgi:hypothetical protein
MLLYAQRAGALGPILQLLERYHDNLLSDELEWLEKAWPRSDRDQFRSAPNKMCAPKQAVLVEWYLVAATGPPNRAT